MSGGYGRIQEYEKRGEGELEEIRGRLDYSKKAVRDFIALLFYLRGVFGLFAPFKAAQLRFLLLPKGAHRSARRMAAATPSVVFSVSTVRSGRRGTTTPKNSWAKSGPISVTPAKFSVTCLKSSKRSPR